MVGPGPSEALRENGPSPADRAPSGRFWRLWSATAISSSGDGLVAVALPLLAFTLTRNPLAIAAVTADQKVFAVLASLPAGVIADRFHRRLVMVVADVLSGAALVALVVLMSSGLAGLTMLYVVAAVLAICDTAYTVALQASVPEVVSSPDRLSTANGRLIGIAGTGESFLGPAIGGFLFSAARRLPFGADAVSFLLAALLVRTSLPRPKSALRHAGGPSDADALDGANAVRRVQGELRHGSGLTADLSAGLRVFRSELVLKLVAVTIAAASFTQAMVVGVLVVYGERTLGLGSTGYGLFMAGAAVMGIAGSFLGGRIERRLGASGVIVVGVLLASVSYLGLSFTRVAVLGAFVYGLQDFGVAIANIGSVTTRQRIVPRHLLGRVASIHRLIGGIAAPAGAIIGGLIASVSSVPWTLFIAGAMQAVMLAYLAPVLVQSTRQRFPATAPQVR